ncbi:MAG TPA: hypothetical protein VI146_02780 [Nitrososphaeraceae archaeon]
MFKLTRYTIMLTLILSIFVFYPITSNTQSLFAQSKQGIIISLANSSFSPLTNTDANQLKVNVKYTIQDALLKNQKINAVMYVFAPNGTLLKISSFPSGFIATGNGGIEMLKSTFNDKLLKSVVANVTFTDLAKSKSLSNILTVKLPLKETPTVGSLLGNKPTFKK